MGIGITGINTGFKRTVKHARHVVWNTYAVRQNNTLPTVTQTYRTGRAYTVTTTAEYTAQC